MRYYEGTDGWRGRGPSNQWTVGRARPEPFRGDYCGGLGALSLRDFFCHVEGRCWECVTSEMSLGMGAFVNTHKETSEENPEGFD